MPATSDESSSSEQSSSDDTPSKGKVRRRNNRQGKKSSGKRRKQQTTISKATNRTKENDGGDDDDGGRGTRRSKRQRTSALSVKYVYSSNSDDDDDNDDDASAGSDESVVSQRSANSDDSDDDPEDVVDNTKKLGAKKKIAKNKSSDLDEGTPSKGRKGGKKASPAIQPKGKKTTFKCLHCGKAFKTSLGLQYHVDKLVCRQEDGTPKKSRDKGRPKKKALKVREPDEDRTCPHCKRIFKSLEGMKYHVEQKVCRRASLTDMGDGKMRAFPTLDPGQQFVTPFGIVEVVKDDRAVPTAIFPKDIQDQYRKYQKAKGTDDLREMGRYAKRAGKLRVRRDAINYLYEKGKANRRSIFESYFGGDPEHIRSVIKANNALTSGKTATNSKQSSSAEIPSRRTYNPKEPEDSFPDRIVECIWITDQRSHVLDIGKDFVKRDAEQPPKKLFLQRKLLKQPYDKVDSVYYCPDCGRTFTSSQSRKAHCVQKKCIQEARNKEEKREEIQMKIEIAVKTAIQFPEKRKFIKNMKTTSIVNKDGNRRKWKKKKKKKETSVYPEVIIAMGFKLVTKQKSGTNNASLKPPTPPLRERGRELDHILDDLKGAFEIQKRKTSDQRHGSIYAEVYKKLGFKFPGKRKGTSVGNNVSKSKRRKRTTKPKAPPPPKPLPPAIDVEALVDEIKSGRYPSFKVFEGDHADHCVLCKNGGKMFCCEFCDNVEHFKCILSKFTVKEPEPDEDFMCHKCIGVILSRRARAEKRRLRKQAKNELKKEEAVTETDPSDGNEYPYMASQAREVNELVELLKDSQVRLRRSIETTKMNNIRRQVISGVYPDGYSPPY